MPTKKLSYEMKDKIRMRFLTFTFMLLAFSSPTFADDLSGRASIIDGDTLAIGNTVIRLLGIDAAESGQRCVGEGRQILRPGDDAATRLASLATGHVTCSGTEYDDYGRLLAHCTTASGVSINEALVREGLAWAFLKYSDEYAKQEQAARKSKTGVWQLACEPPWTFREKRWKVAEQKSPNGCPIKGNISSNGRIYHTPWSRHYARTKVNVAKGERWFCSEAQAYGAGFRPPRR
jgi:endonuclease YncB( thermonuclease family)